MSNHQTMPATNKKKQKLKSKILVITIANRLFIKPNQVVNLLVTYKRMGYSLEKNAWQKKSIPENSSMQDIPKTNKRNSAMKSQNGNRWGTKCISHKRSADFTVEFQTFGIQHQQ